MAYATIDGWSARFGDLDESLDPVVVVDGLEQASRRVDELLGRRSLEPTARTDVRWVHRSRDGDDRHVWLPDWPPLWPERWVCALTSMVFLDAAAEVQQSVTVGDCTLWPERQGLVVLPDGNWVEDGWTVEASYTAGYGTVAAPDIPETLVDATLRIAEATVGSVLTVGRRVDRPVWFVEQDVLAMLRPWQRIAGA